MRACNRMMLGAATIGATMLGLAILALPGHTQGSGADPNAAPDPFKTVENWAQLPPGRKWGMVISAVVDHDGKSLWTVDRCGTTTCEGSDLAPIMHFDADGKLIGSFGAGKFIWPHGLYFDREGNMWVTDARGAGGIGHTVTKFSPKGEVLMTLGRPGVPGAGPDTFNAPTGVLIAPNGDIFVSDGHGGDTNARIVKFDKNGKFIKSWGHKGSGPGEFDTPHALAMDSAGRLFVGDRGNSRLQIFDQEGNLLAEWRQFGSPSGIFIDRDDMMYVADSQSDETHNAPFQQGIRIGSAKDGKVIAFIRDTDPKPNMPEGVGVDDRGNVYGGYVNRRTLRKFIKEGPLGR